MHSNIDTLVDLTMTRFIFNAYLQACKDLDIEAKEKELTEDVKDVLSNLVDTPTTQSKHGEVLSQ